MWLLKSINTSLNAEFNIAQYLTRYLISYKYTNALSVILRWNKKWFIGQNTANFHVFESIFGTEAVAPQEQMLHFSCFQKMTAEHVPYNLSEW